MFVDQREYKEEWYDGRFTLKDLTEDVYKKVVAAYYSNSSGLGGPGTVRLITEDCIQYEIGMDMMREDEFNEGPGYELMRVANKIPLFAIDDSDREDRYDRVHFEVEKEGWTFRKPFGAYYLIRNDYLEINDQEGKTFVDSEDNTHRTILHPFGQIGMYLMSQGKTPKTFIYEGTKAYRIYLIEKWEKYAAEKERVRIRPEDVTWLPIYANNVKCEIVGDPVCDYQGEYLLLVRSDEKEGVVAEKWSIVPQWKDRRISRDGEIMCYNLFVKEYDRGIEGPLRYPEPTGELDDTYKRWWTFRGIDVNNHGRFVFSHRTIEDAKEEALKHATGTIAWGGYNRENLITDYPSKEVEERIIYEKYWPYVLLEENFEKILRIVTEFEYGPTRGGEGWLISELTEKLGITKNEAHWLKNLRIADLNSDSIAFAKKRLKEIGKL